MTTTEVPHETVDRERLIRRATQRKEETARAAKLAYDDWAQTLTDLATEAVIPPVTIYKAAGIHKNTLQLLRRTATSDGDEHARITRDLQSLTTAPDDES